MKKYIAILSIILLTLVLLLSPLTGVIYAQTGVNVDLTGQLGGSSYAVDWEGSIAYVGVGPRILKVTVTNPASPVVTDQSEPLPDVVQGVKVFHGYIYVTTGDSGLFILNSNLDVVGQYDTPGFAYDVDLLIGGSAATTYAFVADGDNGVLAINVNNPSSPTLSSSYQPNVGSSEAVAVSVGLVGDEHVYIAFQDAGLHAWRPFHTPADAYSVAVDDYAEDVTALAENGVNYIYVADGSAGLGIYKWVETPTEELVEVSHYQSYDYLEGLAISNSGSHAYLVGDVGLEIVQITDKAHPTDIDYVTLPGYAYAVAVDTSPANAFVANGVYGLSIVNLSSKSVAASVKDVGSPQDVVLDGSLAFLADGEGGLKIVDITDPADPTLSKAFWSDSGYSNFNGVAVQGNYAFIADDELGLRIFDITQSPPVSVQDVAMGSVVPDVTVSGSYAYVANDIDGVRVVDISTPATASLDATYKSPLSDPSDYSVAAFDVAVSGSYLYVAYGSAGFEVVDISNPLSPSYSQRISSGDGIDFATGVAVNGNYAYVADSSNGLHIIDISTPASPNKVGFVSTAGGPENVAPAGRYYALVADYAEGMKVIDVSDPANPTEIGSYNTAGLAVGVTEGGYAFVADTDGGFWTLNALGTDLEIQKTDGLDTAMHGQVVTYTIEVSNIGTHHADNVTITDTFPAEITNVSWACEASVGSECSAASGSGNIDTTASLLSSGVVTLTASGTVSATSGVVIENKAYVSAALGVDLNPANDIATDTTATATTDLTIAKTDSRTEMVPGELVTYNVSVSNSGGAAVTGARVVDNLPDDVLDASWACTPGLGGTCPNPASGVGNLDALIDLTASGAVTFIISGTVDPAATGVLSNTASVATPAGVQDSNPDDNTATDQTTLTPEVDVLVSESHTGGVKAGDPITYTLIVTNAGPSVTSVDVTDNFPASIKAVTWTCQASSGSGCTASGTGNINESASMLPNGKITFQAVGTVDVNAAGSIYNTVSAAVPAGVTELDPTSNVATDTVSLYVDQFTLTLTGSVTPTSLLPKDEMTYVITVTNQGPDMAKDITLTDALPNDVVFISAVVKSGLAAANACAYANHVVTCDIPSIAQNSSVVINITVQTSTSGDLANSVTVSGGGSNVQTSIMATVEPNRVFMPIIGK